MYTITKQQIKDIKLRVFLNNAYLRQALLVFYNYIYYQRHMDSSNSDIDHSDVDLKNKSLEEEKCSQATFGGKHKAKAAEKASATESEVEDGTHLSQASSRRGRPPRNKSDSWTALLKHARAAWLGLNFSHEVVESEYTNLCVTLGVKPKLHQREISRWLSRMKIAPKNATREDMKVYKQNLLKYGDAFDDADREALAELQQEELLAKRPSRPVPEPVASSKRPKKSTPAPKPLPPAAAAEPLPPAPAVEPLPPVPAAEPAEPAEPAPAAEPVLAAPVDEPSAEVQIVAAHFGEYVDQDATCYGAEPPLPAPIRFVSSVSAEFKYLKADMERMKGALLSQQEQINKHQKSLGEAWFVINEQRKIECLTTNILNKCLPDPSVTSLSFEMEVLKKAHNKVGTLIDQARKNNAGW